MSAGGRSRHSDFLNLVGANAVQGEQSRFDVGCRGVVIDIARPLGRSRRRLESELEDARGGWPLEFQLLHFRGGGNLGDECC